MDSYTYIFDADFFSFFGEDALAGIALQIGNEHTENAFERVNTYPI